MQDRDIDMQLQLHGGAYKGLMTQIRKDTDLLERLHVMDYSLLLGVHFNAWGDEQWHPPATAEQVWAHSKLLQLPSGFAMLCS